MRRTVVLTLASLSLIALPAHGDIVVTRGPDGSLHMTNVPSARRSGGQVVFHTRDGQRPAAATSQPTTAAPDPNQNAQVRSLYAATARDSGRYTRFDEHIREASALYQLPEALIRAVIRQESDYNSYSVSASGAAGLMQLMPQTAQSMNVRDVFDPRQSILGGTRFLRVLANMFNGDLVLTIAAYNAGPNAVVRYAGVPPYDETRWYVRQVLRYYYLYRAGAVPGRESEAPVSQGTLTAR